MKLITWNCQGALRKKLDIILPKQPDILVVQECEHPDKLIFRTEDQKPKDFYWYGDNYHKGISLYSFSDFKFKLLPEFNPIFRYILPFNVTGYGQAFTLFAVWAMDNKENYDARYIGQIWLAINYYSSILDNTCVIIGDFNSSKIWDYKDRVGTHSDVVRKLAQHNIQSVYHQFFDTAQGNEKHPTFFLQRNQNKPYHIDYRFCSDKLIETVRNVEVGDYEHWNNYSNHSPMIIDFNL